MAKHLIIISLLAIGAANTTPLASAQSQQAVQWLDFEQLDDALAVHPKKVFIDFYTSWCTYCRKMDKVVFTKPSVIEVLNHSYYAVRIDAETQDTIQFDGVAYTNEQVGKSRTPIHQLAQILALRNGQFAPPTMIILDEEFNVKQRFFNYLDSKKLIKALSKGE